MIKKLIEADRDRTLSFLSQEAAMNLFIIGDIEAFGFDSDFQELWGQFDGQGDLEGVLLRFNESYIPYLKSENIDKKAFQEIIDAAARPLMLSGKESIVAQFLTEEEKKQIRSTYFCELTEGSALEGTDDIEIKIATVDDAVRITELLDEIVEFQGVSNTPERIAHKISTNTGRVYFVEDENGKMISVSQTSAENKYSAMITGVATLPGYRGKGIMSRCLSKLCRDLLDENRSLCLFYDNPKAGRVYHRLGFQSIGNWVMQSRN